ncbi:MAG: class I fructose-bisphosphate aldolase [Candidatus Asgardarchaeia archaeon]
MNLGKCIRLRRIFNKITNRTVIIPIDHGAYFGPIKGIERIWDVIISANNGGADAILLNPGMIRFIPLEVLGNVGIIVRLSNTNVLSDVPHFETIISSVENALSLGADAVAYTVNIGGSRMHEAIRTFGLIAEECEDFGVPLLGEFIPSGDKIKDPYDVKNVAFASRIGVELGADFIKTNYTGSPETFREVTSTSPIPIVIAGGEKKGTELDVLKMVKGAIDGGGAGVCIGRNVWQRKDPESMIRAICKIVHEDASLEEAYKEIKKK